MASAINPDIKSILAAEKKTWLVTGCAGFIGSNLVEYLIKNNQKVIGVDNYLTGLRQNLDGLVKTFTKEESKNFDFFELDLIDIENCKKSLDGVDIVLHQAALGSVPRSIKHPNDTHINNTHTFANLMSALVECGGRRVVYASSSAVYGDHPTLPKVENQTGNLLSPYALTKSCNELYADVFHRVYDFELIGLRYFNVYGRRQNPLGVYAAVIPRWIKALITGETVQINGDGETSRDFTHIDNVIQMNMRAALTNNPSAFGKNYNVAFGEKTTLNELYSTLKELLTENYPLVADATPHYADFRAGDIRHSLADISMAQTDLSYAPKVGIKQGLKQALSWYIENIDAN